MASNKINQDPLIKLSPNFRSPIKKTIFSLIKWPIEKILRVRSINSIYSDINFHGDDLEFSEQALEYLNICNDVPDEDIERIPTTGPVVAVANHPFGAIEGMLLASLLVSVRKDVKIMANYLLNHIPEMRKILIAVDPFGSKSAISRNIKPLKEAVKWVQNGGLLGVFPAGEVSHLNLKKGVVDPKWNRSIARIIRRSEANVVPIYFDGRNSTLFQLMGMVHKRLRTVMLPREFLNKTNKKIPVRIGKVIPFSKLKEIENDTELIEYIRLRTYLLEKRLRPGSRKKKQNRHGGVTKLGLDNKVIEPIQPELVRSEIENLPKNAKLAENDDYAVYTGSMRDIPNIMLEIGRIREITFRDVGEGTGNEIDLDTFDDYYTQIFVWNKSNKEIVGGYRLGLCDKIIEKHGVHGLYTRTLYKYRANLINQINPAIELGRSFIRGEYQREFAPLHLLWKGIGRFVLRNPKYKMLFGPVSISSRYHSASRQFMVDFLKANSFEQDLARLIKARRPLKTRGPKKWDHRLTSGLVKNLDEVTSLISEIETQHSGVPILLRHYLKLGGKLMAFNIDPDFADALDGLMLVDLTQTPVKILQKYMGEKGAAQFLEYHRDNVASTAD